MQIKIKDIAIEQNDPFKYDCLERKSEIENISSITTNICAPLVMAIDSPWGTGKTTFIKMWRAYLESQQVTTIYFNAWESDYAEDPLVALVSELDIWVKSLNNTELSAGIWKQAKSLLPGIAKSTAVATAKIATFGALDIEKEYEKIASDLVGGTVDDLVDSFNIQSSAISRFKDIVEQTISELGEEQKNLIIFVDELDRCRPTYAIELLERIKHLFNIERLIFVLSTDVEQLSHSICAVYGNDFNARKYLQRFIDIDYSLKKPATKNYIVSLFHSLSINEYFKARKEGHYEQEHLIDCCDIFSTRFDLSLRGINLLLTRVRLVLSSIPSNNYLYEPLLISLLLLREHNIELYNRYCNEPKTADEVIAYFTKGLSSEVVCTFSFSLIAGYLIAPNLDHSNNSRFEELVAPYKKLLADDDNKNSDLAYVADKVLLISGASNGMRRNVNLKTTIERVELLHRIQIE
ncbi:KAP family P-loop NTPase fold protein [Shewanella baltica]|uniref:KAP family P-loop NTPase fold protein n=1 Tax=Shewanella baltica TaxID=62322 RepID=UPI00014F8BB6|nr:P-loop NTPase fold protein [Shewanella baltica]ABS09484.1 KAP P-loop domain protein [Shewanella baltica OS185]